MIIKKFQAKTESEAVALAKKELGDNLVIMNVKQLKKKSFFGLLGSDAFEVTVALESEPEKNISEPVVHKEVKGPIVPDSVWEKGNFSSKSRSTAVATDETGQAIVEKLDGLQSLLKQQLESKKEQNVKSDKLSSEVLSFLKILYNTLIENEVLEQYANELIDEININGSPELQMDLALSNIYQKMILKFGQPKLIHPAKKNPKIIYFVGPTGVGKTTTIAKIASRFALEEKKKIALMTADTYRIAAAEQLRTYANILEVPFRVVYTPEEIVQAVEELKDLDFILIDTAGHAHQNEEQRNSVRDFIHATGEDKEKEVFLVVSSTTKYRDLVGIADAYKDVYEYKLIFTKLDETTVYGNMYNLHLHTKAPLSYVTCGQNVPDDISIFNPQTTVKKILSR